MKTSKPLIGVSMSWNEADAQKRPYHHIRDAYIDSLKQAGAEVILLTLDISAIPTFLSLVDGIVLPGGSYPSPAWWYGEEGDHEPDHPRALYDLELARRSLDADIPFLGICAGFQNMAAATGGLIYRNVKEALQTTVPHRDMQAEDYAHEVNVVAGSLLHRITGQTRFMVNSRHAEGVAKLGPTAVVNATASDGLIEALEIPGKRFALGAQWHPEFFPDASTSDGKIWRAFVQAALDYRNQKA
jgi:putative glutamine amidotransferase